MTTRSPRRTDDPLDAAIRGVVKEQLRSWRSRGITPSVCMKSLTGRTPKGLTDWLDVEAALGRYYRELNSLPAPPRNGGRVP